MNPAMNGIQHTLLLTVTHEVGVAGNVLMSGSVHGIPKVSAPYRSGICMSATAWQVLLLLLLPCYYYYYVKWA